MKIRINKLGILEIERAGKMKEQLCPRQPGIDPCGDWCALFGEPEDMGEEIGLELCDDNAWYPAKEDFEDLRGFVL